MRKLAFSVLIVLFSFCPAHSEGLSVRVKYTPNKMCSKRAFIDLNLHVDGREVSNIFLRHCNPFDRVVYTLDSAQEHVIELKGECRTKYYSGNPISGSAHRDWSQGGEWRYKWRRVVNHWVQKIDFKVTTKGDAEFNLKGGRFFVKALVYVETLSKSNQ